MRITIFFKAFFWYAVLAMVLLSIVLVYSIHTMRNHYIDTLTAHLSHLCSTLSLSVQALVDENNLAELNRLAVRMGEETGTRITVVDRAGVVLADSREDPLRMENHKGRPEIARALRGGVGSSTRFSDTMGGDMHYVAVPLVKDGQGIGVLRVSRFLTEIDDILWALDKQLDRMLAEGLENRFARHTAMAERVQTWSIEHGMEPLTPEGYRSKTVSTIKNLREVDIPALNQFLLTKGMRIANGYGDLKNKTFRIAHMGETTMEDVNTLLEAFEAFLNQM